eukprot:gene13592-4487_t
MDDLSPSSGIKETKKAPARPPLPSSANASSGASSSGEEKSPEKRCAKPVQMPSSIQQHLDELRDLQKNKVRWFYKEGKKWIPFNGKDSLVMEEEWQALQKETDVGMSEKPSKPTVRGKLFEVDLLQRQCSPLYWKVNGSSTPILRGTWFKKTTSLDHWEPLDENDAIQIEKAHQGVIRSLGYGSSDVMETDSPVMHMIRLGAATRVEWHEINEVRLIHETTGSRLAQKIGIGGSDNLARGWHTNASVIDDIPEINHLVFLIHGMGQLMHQAGGIVSSAHKFRDKVIKKHFKDCFKTGRVEFFPVEWRTSLKLDEGLVDAVTPTNVIGLRKIINETTMDIMYYTSSYFRNEIIKSLRHQLNSIYVNFVNRNPEFLASGGKVSVIAHSLGSVIFHDILTDWNNQLLEEHKQQADKNVAAEGRWSWIWGSGKRKVAQESLDVTEAQIKERAALQEELRQTKLKVAELEAKIRADDNQPAAKDMCQQQCGSNCSLNFKVENVFSIGSPLGAFLILKGIRPRDDLEQHILPSSVCSRFFNIYDPTDPIAYRLEPLIYEHYADIPPVKIKRLTKSGSIDENEESSLRETGSANWFKSWFNNPSKIPPKAASFHDEHVELQQETEQVMDILKERKALKQRIDYVLEGGFVEYLSVITSHTSYWESQEFTRFILKTISGDHSEPVYAIGL